MDLQNEGEQVIKCRSGEVGRRNNSDYVSRRVNTAVTISAMGKTELRRLQYL